MGLGPPEDRPRGRVPLRRHHQPVQGAEPAPGGPVRRRRGGRRHVRVHAQAHAELVGEPRMGCAAGRQRRLAAAPVAAGIVLRTPANKLASRCRCRAARRGPEAFLRGAVPPRAAHRAQLPGRALHPLGARTPRARCMHFPVALVTRSTPPPPAISWAQAAHWLPVTSRPPRHERWPPESPGQERDARRHRLLTLPSPRATPPPTPPPCR